MASYKGMLNHCEFDRRIWASAGKVVEHEWLVYKSGLQSP